MEQMARCMRSAAWSAACSAPTATSATRSRSAASSPTRSISRSAASASTSPAATWRCGSTPAMRTIADRVAGRSSTTSPARQLRPRPQQRRAGRPRAVRSPLWSDAGVAPAQGAWRATQLGTVGSGNHYVDLFEDEEGFVWIGVHFGSRGLGHKTATKHLKLAGGKDGMEVDADRACTRTAISAQRYIAGDDARRPVRLCRPRVGGGDGARDHRRRGDRHRAQPPQLRLARAPRRARAVGGAQGRDAGVPGPARLRRRLDGRRRRDPVGRRERGRRRQASTRPCTAPAA